MNRLMRARRAVVDPLAVFKKNGLTLLQPKPGYIFKDSTRLDPANNLDFVGGLTAITGSTFVTQATAANKPQLKVTAAGNNYLNADGLNDALNFNTPIPNGAWFSDMQNIDYLKNSNTATTNTIVDHLGNTITLTAGEIGWNNSRRVENIYINSELEDDFNTYIPTNVVLASMTGFNKGATFPNNLLTRALHKSTSITAGRKYHFSFYLEIASAPSVGITSSNDFRLAIPVGGTAVQPTSLEQINSGLYRIHVVFIAPSTVTTNIGVVKTASNNNSSFKVSGYQLVDITGIAANDYDPEYIKSNTMYNAGVTGIKYFNSDIYKQPLSAQPTIKVNAGDNISIAGDLYAMAYGPTIPSESDRLKIEKYTQDAKL